MPPVASDETFSFQRALPVETGYDLIVAGGGPGGTAAAISAGRLGAKVLLLEATGCLGGMGTGGLVSNWSDVADGEKMIVGGLMAEIIETMYSRGQFRPGINPNVWRKQLHSFLGYNAEGLKLLLDELCMQAGVELRFFTRMVEVDHDGLAVKGVIIHNIEGLRYVRGKAFIDATGDAVLADLCGAACFEAGRDTPHIMPPTLCTAQASIDWAIWTEGQLSSTAEHLKTTQQAAVYQAIADGFFTQPDRHVPGLFRNGPTTAIMNAGHIFGMNALNCRSLSDGMMQGRRFAEEYVRFFRKYLKGCERMEFVTTAGLMGVRESRRIAGEYELNFRDFALRRSFPDQIAIYNKPVDRHVNNVSDQEWARMMGGFMNERPGPGEYYGIPYGILVPRGSTNLWVAGRCNSSDPQVYAAIRDQPACFMMGQAAGTAAVQSMATGQPACDLDTAQLVETLRKAGAYLPQAECSRQMTRDN